jgi:hypothetical protein
VEPRQILRSGITASALAHVLCLVLVIFFAEVHPFGSVTAEPIAVDLVRPDEVAAPKPPDPELPPKEKEKAPDSHEIAPNLDLAPKPQSETKAASASSPPAAVKPPQASAAPAQKQAAAAPPAPSTPAALPPTAAPPSPVSPPTPAAASNPAPGFGQQPAAQAQAPLPTPVMPSYVPAQPDVSIKYHVALGLPQGRPGDGFDAPATQKADVGTDSIAEFRRHLKSCSKLPGEIGPSDKVAIKLRVLMSPDGRLAAPPVLIEASASMKGPLLMQSAISALDACQPYAMLPADRYKEWKVLDLVFTPQDFAGAS